MSLKTSAYNAYHFLWAWIGARRQKNPSKRIFVIGVTGTKGKTTTLELINAILEAAGKRTAILSSLRMKIGEGSQKNPTGNSMPGRGEIQRFLRRARWAGCGYALVEVTSQGVVQHRHRFVDWNMGVLTNLHPEHIESHGSFENYRAAKLEFLKYVLKKGGKVFLNSGDKEFGFFAKNLANASDSHEALELQTENEKIIAYTRTDKQVAEHVARAEQMRDRASGGVQDAATGASRFLLGNFNVENIAVAVAIAKELGIADKVIEEALASFAGVPGRMEFVTSGPYTAIVDYAHTPDSLEAAYLAAQDQLDSATSLASHLSSFSENPSPRLICVLGAAGGGRDKWKRPEFGRIAAHYCDEIILTDEDPYDENPAAIIDEVAAGIKSVPHPRPEFVIILDRREALTHAINIMVEGDIVIATGKGSEDWIHVARSNKIPWNEKSIMQELLLEKK